MEVNEPVQPQPLDQLNVISPIPPEIPKKSSKKLLIPVISVALVLLVGLGYLSYRNYVASEQIKNTEPTPSNTPAPTPEPMESWKEKKFEKFELTFKAPSGLTMEESELSPGKLAAYIQNDKIGDDFFQMNFMYQKSGPMAKQSDIETLKNDPEFVVPGTTRNTSIDGYPGFAGQVADKRGRFVTAVIKDGYWLIIYIAEPTQANKELSERIISTFKFTN